MTDVATTPITVDFTAPDRDKFSHLVNEGFNLPTGDFLPLGNSVVEGMINGTEVVALCGKRLVPNDDPTKYPLCPTCEEIAARGTWEVAA